MGWKPLEKVSKTLSGIAKNPTNLRNYADLGAQSLTMGQVDTKGINGVGSFEDVLLGKKAKDIKPDSITNLMRSTQAKGLNDLNAALDSAPSEDIVREQVERQKKGVLSSAQDARREAQRSIAQTGLKNSSLGLALNRSITQQAGDNMADINAQTPGLIRDQKLKDATTRIQLGGINTQGMNFNTIQGQRSGGVLGIASALAPIAGTVGGMMVGGPAGAAVGSQVGGGISSAFNRTNNQYGNYA